jgi:hypothetical protein
LEEAKADLVRDGFMGAVSLALSWQFSFIYVLRNTLSCFHDKFFYPCTKKHTYHAFMTNSFFHVLRNTLIMLSWQILFSTYWETWWWETMQIASIPLKEEEKNIKKKEKRHKMYLITWFD